MIQYRLWLNDAVKSESILDFDGWCKNTHIKRTYENKKFAAMIKTFACMLIGCTTEQLEDREFKEKPLGKEWDLYNLLAGNNEFYALNKTLDELKNTFTKTYNEGRYVTKSMTPRLLLQLLGTEAGREIIHPNLWVIALFSTYRDKDLTFEEKIKLAKSQGTEVQDDDWTGLEEELSRRFDLDGEKRHRKSKWIITDVRFPNEVEAIKSRGGMLIKIERPRLKLSKHEHSSETALDHYTDWDLVIQNDGTIVELFNKISKFI